MLITIRKAVDASPELRSKKQLIENFIAGINAVDDVMNEWNSYVAEQRTHDPDAIIAEEKLKPEDTRRFMEHAFRDGEIKTSGTDIAGSYRRYRDLAVAVEPGRNRASLIS